MNAFLILGTLFHLGPLVGLVGTIVAMFRVFAVITRHGTGDPSRLSEGVAVALWYSEIGMLCGLAGIVFLTVGHVLKFRDMPFGHAQEESDRSYIGCAVLNVLFGTCGAHQFYAGRTGWGFLFVFFFIGGLLFLAGGRFIFLQRLIFFALQLGRSIDFIALSWGNFTDSDGKRIRFRRKVPEPDYAQVFE